MEEEHRDEGLVLLTVNLDDPSRRSRIPEFLKKYELHARVLLGDSDSLQEYETRVASSLYVVDRKGILAGVPSEFYVNFGKRVKARLPDLLQGKPSPGPVLWGVEKAPQGFGILWKRDLGSAVTALAIAPAGKGRPAEIGLADQKHLTRYSAAGDHLREAPLEGGQLHDLRGGDLDGDGRNEWIAGSDDGGITLMDGAGEEYWRYDTYEGTDRVVDFIDLDGDGSKEIVLQGYDSVVAKKLLPGNLWKTPAAGRLLSVVPDPRGTLLVQSREGISPLDRAGNFRRKPVRVQGAAVLKGRIDREDGSVLDLFGSPYPAGIDSEHDLDGDGRKDILVSGRGGIAIYSQDGSPLLILWIAQNQFVPVVALGNLDGRPGDELVLAIPEYGLVALGTSPGAGPLTGPVTPAGDTSSPGR